MDYDVYSEASKLSKLPADTDSRDWPLGKKLLYEEGAPGLWARICLVAAALTQEPMLAIWLLIECVNGLRRESGKWDVSFASGLLDAIRERIELLPDQGGPCVLRLRELWCYHSGWVYHPAGQFTKAVECHRQSIGLASNPRARSLSEYNMLYEGMHHAIVMADPQLADRFREYVHAAQETLGVLSSNEEDDKRWRANIQGHLAVFTWMVSGEIAVSDALAAFEALPGDTRNAFSEAEVVIGALNVLTETPLEAVGIANGINPEGQIDWRSYAMYIHGVALAKVGKAEESQEVFTHLLTLPNRENGGHLVAALIEQSFK
jgi:hypothetical protein